MSRSDLQEAPGGERQTRRASEESHEEQKVLCKEQEHLGVFTFRRHGRGTSAFQTHAQWLSRWPCCPSTPEEGAAPRTQVTSGEKILTGRALGWIPVVTKTGHATPCRGLETQAGATRLCQEEVELVHCCRHFSLTALHGPSHGESVELCTETLAR